MRVDGTIEKGLQATATCSEVRNLRPYIEPDGVIDVLHLV